MSKIDEDFKFLEKVLIVVGGLFLFWFIESDISSHKNNLNQKKVNGHPIECIDGITYFVGRTVTPQVDQNNKPVLCNF